MRTRLQGSPPARSLIRHHMEMVTSSPARAPSLRFLALKIDLDIQKPNVGVRPRGPRTAPVGARTAPPLHVKPTLQRLTLLRRL